MATHYLAPHDGPATFFSYLTILILCSLPSPLQVLPQLPQRTFTMPPKKTVAPGPSKNPPASTPSKSSRQRTLTNKQQQLRKISSYFVLPIFFKLFLVAQKNEKEEAAKQRALTDAIRSEQRIEEINGFYKSKLPGNLSSIPSTSLLLIYFHIELPPNDDDFQVAPESEDDDDEPLTVSLTNHLTK
jgi:hypothetical protein